MIHKLLKRPQAIIGLCLIAIVIVIAIAAPAFSPHDPELVNLSQKYAQPDAEYPLGTDQLGRCTLSRLLYGARYSIGISLPVLLILSVIGLIVGTFSACAGEKADHFITILCDVFIAFPSLIIAIAVIGVLGNGLQNIAVSVVIAPWAWFVRIVRSYSVQEMGKDYILAARISGCNTGKLIIRHLIPNILPQFLVYVSTGVASSIIMVSSFAFLGLGLPSGTPEWGAMLNDARTALYSHPELLIYPGLCILLGQSGSGKTMTCSAVLNLLDPKKFKVSGSVFFGETDLLNSSEKQRRGIYGNQIVYIPQNPMTALDPSMRIGRQMDETLRLHSDKSRQQRYNYILQLLHDVGLDDPDRVYRAYPHMLSGGMLQRVIIAMAMMLDAKFVLADEPTTALDVIHRNGIIDLFSQMKANGVGILMVTHDFATALQLGGNVLVMKEGKIIESGEVQSVFDHTTEPYTRSLIEAYSLSCAFTKGAES